jgi:hypothetical protein
MQGSKSYSTFQEFYKTSYLVRSFDSNCPFPPHPLKFLTGTPNDADLHVTPGKLLLFTPDLGFQLGYMAVSSGQPYRYNNYYCLEANRLYSLTDRPVIVNSWEEFYNDNKLGCISLQELVGEVNGIITTYYADGRKKYFCGVEIIQDTATLWGGLDLSADRYDFRAMVKTLAGVGVKRAKWIHKGSEKIVNLQKYEL